MSVVEVLEVGAQMSGGAPPAADDRPKAGGVRRLAKTIIETALLDGALPRHVVAQVPTLCTFHFFVSK